MPAFMAQSDSSLEPDASKPSTEPKLAKDPAKTYAGSNTPSEDTSSEDIAEARFLSHKLDASISEENLHVISAHLDDRSVPECLEIIQGAIDYHRNDPCVPHEFLEDLTGLLEQTPQEGEVPNREWEESVKFEAFLIADWSIYPEVRAVTHPIEEPGDNDYETFRVYVIGLVLSCAGSVLDTFFLSRWPVISLSSSAIQIILAAWGKLWGRMPKFGIPLWKGKKFWINPGPWTMKEQMLCTLTMSVSVGAPYSAYAFISQQNKYFYGFDNVDFGYMMMLTLSSQFMGFGIAGIMRAFLVYPQDTVWYFILPNIALNRGLMAEDKREPVNGWKLLRIELFGISVLCFFIWFWITNFVFQALMYFSWMAWIAPKNVDLNIMTGLMSGLGLSFLTSFDLNVIGASGMVTPWFSTVNQYIGLWLGMFAVLIIYYTNVRWTGHLPINVNSLYANDGTPFSVQKVINEKGLLDMEKYKEYSIPFYTAGNLVSYGAFFMIYPAMVVYSILNYPSHMYRALTSLWQAIRHPSKGSLKNFNDRFSREQKRFKEVPEWWFLLILLFSFGMAVATVQHYKFTSTPVWTIVFAIGLGTLFTPLFGRLYATSNLSLSINVIFELIIGYALPGNGNALMVSKVYATNFISQTDNYITNQKQIHYVGIAPRPLFRAQILSVIVNSFAQVGILQWQMNGGIDDFCNPQNPSKFSCVQPRTYFNAGVFWGSIGPKRVFDTIYPQMKWCFLIGAVYPIPFWLLKRFGPRKLRKAAARKEEKLSLEAIRSGRSGIPETAKERFFSRLRRVSEKLVLYCDDLNEMLILAGTLEWGNPGGLWGKTENLVIGAFFNYFVKKRYNAWWSKYNYILYNAIGVGTGYAGLIMFFSTEYKHLVDISWWGNNVIYKTSDSERSAIKFPLTEGEKFGPTSWS